MVADSVVNSGLWLNVECNIGIVSACLPILRPLFSKTFPGAVRSKLSRSRPSGYGSGSQRLPDVEKGVRSSTLGGSTDPSGGSGVGGNSQNHKTWYNAAATAKTSKSGDTGSDCSQEEMVPMGRIAVRHDVDWEASDKDGSMTRTA